MLGPGVGFSRADQTQPGAPGDVDPRAILFVACSRRGPGPVLAVRFGDSVGLPTTRSGRTGSIPVRQPFSTRFAAPQGAGPKPPGMQPQCEDRLGTPGLTGEDRLGTPGLTGWTKTWSNVRSARTPSPEALPFQRRPKPSPACENEENVPSPPVAGKGVHAQPPHSAEAGKEETKKETIPWPTPSRSKPSS
jgi:hypothetical protein